MKGEENLSTAVGAALQFGRTACDASLALACVLGAAANALSAVVFLRARFRRCSINILLASLSLVDFGVLLLALPIYAANILLPTRLVIALYPLTAMLQCASVHLLVAITIERWIAVCKPLHAAALCYR